MTYRPLDIAGDMTPVLQSAQLETGIAAVAAAVKSRLALFQGEWWENKNLGFAVPAFLRDSIRRGNAEMLVNYISAYILDTPGVVSVSDVKWSAGQQLFFTCTVHGSTDAVEVSATV